MSFTSFDLPAAVQRALADAGHTQATPIQTAAIPMVLAGHDVMACAQTGTGKTAAFALPALARLSASAPKTARGPRVLVLAPTRELVNQILAAFGVYAKHGHVRAAAVVGGVPYPAQIKALARPLDILIATPGRLIDHLERKRVDLSGVEMLILDEADRMLDMGFIHAVEQIAQATPSTRQTLLFSATLAGKIAKLSQRLLKSPKHIEVTPAHERHANIEQRLHLADDVSHKHRLLKHLLADDSMDKAIVFTATKRGADQLARTLQAQGHAAAALHGDMNQRARNRTLSELRSGNVQLLVATDVAARGIDVNGVSHVINFDVPRVAEDYVHRIGRTGRAGATGVAISLALPADRGQWRAIERFTGHSVTHDIIPGLAPKPQTATARPAPQGRQRPRSNQPAARTRPNHKPAFKPAVRRG